MFKNFITNHQANTISFKTFQKCITPDEETIDNFSNGCCEMFKSIIQVKTKLVQGEVTFLAKNISRTIAVHNCEDNFRNIVGAQEWSQNKGICIQAVLPKRKFVQNTLFQRSVNKTFLRYLLQYASEKNENNIHKLNHRFLLNIYFQNYRQWSMPLTFKQNWP